MFCEAQVAEFRPHVEPLERAGVRVAIIGSGGPSFARGFKERLGITIPIYSDQARASYNALGMHRSAWSLIRPEVIWAGAKVLARGIIQRCIQGDNQQQGGVAVVRKGGEIVFLHRARYSGDHARPQTVVDAALSAK
jgi:hypothetical protein